MLRFGRFIAALLRDFWAPTPLPLLLVDGFVLSVLSDSLASLMFGFFSVVPSLSSLSSLLSVLLPDEERDGETAVRLTGFGLAMVLALDLSTLVARVSLRVLFVDLRGCGCFFLGLFLSGYIEEYNSLNEQY